VDTSNPAAPFERGSLKMRGGILTIAMTSANTLVTTNLSEGVQIVDVSDVAAPALVTTYFTDGYAQAVAASRDLAYVTDSPTGVYILDMSTPRSPAVTSTLSIAVKPLGSGEMPAVPSPLIGISVPTPPSPATAVVLDKLIGRVELFDVTNPRSATKLGAVDTRGRSQCLAVRGSRAYVGGLDGVQVMDFSNRSAPTLAGSFKTAQPPQYLAVDDALVFAALGREGVVIVRQGS